MSNLKCSPTVENIVASTGVNQELNLESVAEDLDSTDYDREKFPGAVYRTQNPKSASLIFRTGKIVCTGTKSTDDVYESLDIVFDELRGLGIDVPSNPEIVIQNIVSTGDLDCPVNLHATAIGFGLENTEYEPEQFPGLVYRLDDPDVVTLIFGSGKVVVTGAKEPAEADRALDVISSRLGRLDLLA